MKTLLTLVLIGYSFSGFSQDSKPVPNNPFEKSYQSPTGIYRCFTDEIMAEKIKQNPAVLDSVNSWEKRRQEAKGTNYKLSLSDSVYYIPVVVHIIHNNGVENISLTKIQSQIDVLNEDYRKLAGTPGAGNGVDTKYQFFLAQKDPQGNCTDGVVRVQSSLTNSTIGGQSALKALSQWDPYKYLNMWVVRSIAGGILGYSSFPTSLSTSPNLDGVVMGYNYFGDIPPVSPPYHLGRTTTHELGHWLGIFHNFSGGCAGLTNSTCGFQGDGVCDTPPSANPNFGCPATAPNTCAETTTATGGDIPDLIENYMDYSDDICMDMFTQGQKDEMNFYSNSIRTLIHDSLNLVATGFYGCFGGTLLTSTNQLCNGEDVTLSFGLAGVPPFKVYYNDGVQNFFLDSVFSGHQEVHMPSITTTYTLDSITDSTGTTDTNTSSSMVTVMDVPVAAFTSSINGLSVGLLSQSTGAQSLIWQFGDGSLGAGSLANHTYDTAGTYTIKLVAKNSLGCADTAFETISVISGINPRINKIGEIKVFPNPAKNKLTVKVNPFNTGSYSVEVIGNNGISLLKKSLLENFDTHEIELDMSQLAPGIYFLNISDDQGNYYAERIIKL
jgi:PKD repeat protein